MINSIELQIISRILTSDDTFEIDRLCSYDSSYYSIFKSEIEFILDHKDKHGTVPDPFTFQARFETIELVEVHEPLTYLEEEIKKNKQQILLLETFNKLADLGSGDVSEAWEYLNRQCELSAELDTSMPMDIVKDADLRAEQILEFNKQRRIPTGFPDIDKLMYGGLSTVEEFMVVIARTNSGKAQPLWSNVLTPQGWVKMGDIQLGDVVIGQNNDNGKVIKIFPQGEKDYYRVIFDDNTYVECCDDHLWTVLDSKRRERSNSHYGEHVVLTTKDIRENINNKYSVDITEPVEFDIPFDETNELDGYLLGLLLGDGGFRDGGIVLSNESEEIWDNISDILKKYNCIRSGKDNNRICCLEYGKNFIRTKLKEYDLLFKRSIDKFIPKQFLTAPIHVRKALLSGLVDTDGYISKDSKMSWEFDTASEQLAYDFVELARSLGVKVKLFPRQKSFYSVNGVKKEASGVRHIVCRSTFNPFRYSKKAERYECRTVSYKRSMPKRHCKMIRAIEYIGKTECQCILLDNETHTYITDGFTTTHNSWVCAKMMESAHANDFPVLYYSPEMQSAFIGTRFDTWRGHFKNSELFQGKYTDEYKDYLKNLSDSDVPAFVVEDSDMSGGRTTVHSLEELVKRYHIKLLIIDGLSYIAPVGKYANESLKYKDICNELFRLSKVYGCAVVAAIQANRETRESRDENGEPFPTIYNAADSDHPARIATQVFALRQLYEQHILELRLEKSRNAKNEKPLFRYAIDFNTGSLDPVDSDESSVISSDTSDFQTPIVTTITQTVETPVDAFDDDDYDDVEF